MVFVKEVEVDCLIIIGGGLLIDMVKVIGIILMNLEFLDVISLEGVVDIKNLCLFILVVLMIFGIVVEVMINYVIIDEVNYWKFVCVDFYDILIVVFIDSDMMMGMLKKLVVLIGMDVMMYVIEGLIIKGVWEMIDMLYLKVIEIIGYFLEVFVEGD